MKRHIATACLVMALTAADTFSQDEVVFHPRRVVTAPSGKFHIDWVKDGLAVVAAESKGETPNLLPSPRDVADRESVPETPFVFVSPDDRWIFVVWRSGGYWPDTIAELYHVVDSSKLRFEFATKERFDRLAWKFLSRNESLDDSEIAKPSGSGAQVGREVAFAAWSADDARLLISLSAPVGDAAEDSVLRKPGIGSWLCYFNTRTGEFELTERLKTFNRDARKRWQNQMSQVGRETFPLAAEMIGKEGPWSPPKERLERADRHLNAIYSALLKQLPPAAQAKLRQEEREWLVQRDIGASIHAHQSWSPAPEAALLEGQAIATESRVAELEKRRKKPTLN
jgi:hypothetical protein